MRPDVRTRRSAPVLGTIAAVVLAATVLTGCGSDATSTVASEVPSGTSTEAAQITVLTTKQATSALLTGQNLGGGFTVADSHDADENESLGCLDVLDDGEDDPTAVTVTKERTFDAVSRVRLPSLTTGIYSYDDIAPASDPFEATLTALEGCTKVDETRKDGVRIRLGVSTDSDTATPDADEQLNLTATGSITSRGSTVPFGVWASVVRIDNHVVSVIYTDLDVATGADSTDALTRAAVGRLVAVLAGEEPSQTLVGIGGHLAA